MSIGNSTSVLGGGNIGASNGSLGPSGNLVTSGPSVNIVLNDPPNSNPDYTFSKDSLNVGGNAAGDGFEIDFPNGSLIFEDNGGTLTISTGAQPLNLSADTISISSISQVESEATVGAFGIPAIVAGGSYSALTGAKSSAAIYTPGNSNICIELSASVLVTSSVSHSFTVTYSYTDENGTARIGTFPFYQLSGTSTLTTITNTTGVGPYSSVPILLRSKEGSAVTVSSVGTFTTVNYNLATYIRALDH